MVFTTKFTKQKGKRPPPMVRKFAEGGIVPLPKDDPRTGLMPRSGDMNYRNSDAPVELRTKAGWKEEARQIKREQAADALARHGASERSPLEHIKAGARAIWEGSKFREREQRYGARDKTNPLYDRKKLPPEKEE